MVIRDCICKCVILLYLNVVSVYLLSWVEIVLYIKDQQETLLCYP